MYKRMILPWLWKKNQQQKVNSCVGHLLVGPSILILRITSSFQLKKKTQAVLGGLQLNLFHPAKRGAWTITASNDWGGLGEIERK